jgi:hypothetical protein
VTAIRARRTRSTLLALGGAVVGVVAAAGLTIAGLDTLADSTAGRHAEGPSEIAPSQRLPYTSTALVGTVDDDGRLTSVVAIALEPDGTGGSMVAIAATADAQSGTTDELRPLAAVLQVEGGEAFLSAAEGLTGLSFDVVEVVEPRRFAQLVTPLGDLPVRFPIPLRDASSGEQWEVGDAPLAAAAAVRAVTATDPAIADWYLEPGRQAVWEAVAERVGAGIGSAVAVDSDQDLPMPRNLDEYVDRLFAGEVQFRSLSFRPIDDVRVADQLAPGLGDAFGGFDADAVVTHDRAELSMVFGAVAPGRVGAPLDAPSFRVVAGFGEPELDALGVNNADVLKQAIDRLLFVQVNIVSVADLPASDVPEVTRIEVADPEVLDAVREGYDELFGPIEVTVADVAIEGVDIEVTLGRSFLAEVEPLPETSVAGDDSAPDVAGSGVDASDQD